MKDGAAVENAFAIGKSTRSAGVSHTGPKARINNASNAVVDFVRAANLDEVEAAARRARPARPFS